MQQQISTLLMRRDAMTFAARALLLGAGIVVLFVFARPVVAYAAAAKRACVVRTADGTGISHKAAKFELYETLLQASDWSLWAAWMANGTTPGYKVGPAKYKCQTGTGLGVTCRGQATICKL
jgi:hypothetical protein